MSKPWTVAKPETLVKAVEGAIKEAFPGRLLLEPPGGATYSIMAKAFSEAGADRYAARITQLIRHKVGDEGQFCFEVKYREQDPATLMPAIIVRLMYPVTPPEVLHDFAPALRELFGDQVLPERPNDNGVIWTNGYQEERGLDYYLDQLANYIRFKARGWRFYLIRAEVRLCFGKPKVIMRFQIERS